MCLGPLASLDNKYTTFGKLVKAQILRSPLQETLYCKHTRALTFENLAQGNEVLKALGSAKTVKGDYPVLSPPLPPTLLPPHTTPLEVVIPVAGAPVFPIARLLGCKTRLLRC